MFGTVVASNGTVEVAGAAISDITGNVNSTADGTIELNTLANNVSFGGHIDNDGRLLKTGSGTLTLSDNSTGDTGITEIRGGVLASRRIHGQKLVLSGGSFLATGDVDIADLNVATGTQGTLNTNANTIQLSSILSGGGTLVKSGTGSLEFVGNSFDANNFTGVLNIQNGTVANIPDLANAQIELASNGRMTIGTADRQIGSLAGSGTVQFLDNGGNAPSLWIGGNNQSTSYSGELAGDGTIVKTGTGNLTFSGNAGGFAGNFVVEEGRLVLNSLPAGNSQTNITIHSNAVLKFDQSTDFAGDLFGSGSIDLTTGSGNVRLRGNNGSYSGEIIIGNGRNLLVGQGNSLGNQTDLNVQAGGRVEIVETEYWGGLSGSGIVDLNDISNVRAGLDNQDMSFSGTFLGSTTFEKHGAGNFEFSGDASALGGEFQVVEGSLSGDGIFNNLHIFANAVLNPGSSPGKMEMESLQLDTGATLHIELGGMNAGTEFDQLVINGNAEISGELSVEMINGFQLDELQYFLIADIQGELTGQFEGLGEGDFVLSQSDTELFITYQAGSGNGIALFTVPEPSGFVLIPLAICLATIGRRRKGGS